MSLLPFNFDLSRQYLVGSMDPQAVYLKKQNFVGTFVFLELKMSPIVHAYGVMFEQDTWFTQVVGVNIGDLLAANTNNRHYSGVWTSSLIDRYSGIQLVESRPNGHTLSFNDYQLIFSSLYHKELVQYLVHLKNHPQDKIMRNRYQDFQKTLSKQIQEHGLSLELKGLLIQQAMKEV